MSASGADANHEGGSGREWLFGAAGGCRRRACAAQAGGVACDQSVGVELDQAVGDGR